MKLTTKTSQREAVDRLQAVRFERTRCSRCAWMMEIQCDRPEAERGGRGCRWFEDEARMNVGFGARKREHRGPAVF